MKLSDIIGLTEFRKNFGVFFDTAKNGQPVYIRRGDEMYKLTHLPAKIIYSDDHPENPKNMKADHIVYGPVPETPMTRVAVMGTPADVWTTQDVKQVPSIAKVKEPTYFPPEDAA